MIKLKKLSILATAAATALLSSSVVMAQEASSVDSAFSEPSRGFMLEHGTVADKGDVSVDLLTGEYNTAGGVRIGLGDAEIILNSGLSGASQNEVALKYGLPSFKTSYGTWNVAAYGGISYYSDDYVDNYSTYTLGGAFTLQADKATITINPQVAVVDINGAHEEMYSIGLGAYYNILENDYGRFSPGFEITYDDVFEETEYSAGVRWGVNDRATIDFAILNKYVTGMDSTNETTDFPGVVRLNVAF